MKKVFTVKGMHCNSCAHLIEKELKEKVNSISVDYASEKAEIDFDESKIAEKEIIDIINEKGYVCTCQERPRSSYIDKNKTSNIFAWIFVALGVVALLYIIYTSVLPSIDIPEISLPQSGDNIGLSLLFVIGILTGFHCISMCGAFVVSYTAKNAISGHKGYKQHLVYGGAKVLSYTMIGGIFGLIGGIIAFNILLRGSIAIFAGLFMIFYALGMMGIRLFKKLQFNPKFLTKFAMNVSSEAKGYYKRPLITGLLNGLFIACGPLQAMYLYAAGTGSFMSGASGLAFFGLGTLPVMLGFGIFASKISHNTTAKILKLSAIIVLILGLIMLNRGLTLVGSPLSYDSIKGKIMGEPIVAGGNVVIKDDVQEINMIVDGSGYSPNSFVLKKGMKTRWNIDVRQLTGCNNEIIVNDYGLDIKLKKGINTIEFTPEKAGTVRWSCWMGMLRGSFIVTEDGTASQEQIVTATPPAGHQCGGNGGGGCGCN